MENQQLSVTASQVTGFLVHFVVHITQVKRQVRRMKDVLNSHLTRGGSPTIFSVTERNHQIVPIQIMLLEVYHSRHS